MREALRSLIALSFFCGLCLHICPEGSAKRVLALLSAAILTAAFLSPLRETDYGTLALTEARFTGAEAELTQRSAERGDRLRLLLFEENCARFLRANAEALQLTLIQARLEIVTGEDGLPVPYAVEIRAEGSEESAETLSRILRDELNIPLERQAWTLNE